MLIHIDLELDSIRNTENQSPETLRIIRTTDRRVNRVQRNYYVALDNHLLLLVVWGKLAFEIEKGDYFEGLVGWDSGYAPFVPEAQRGLKHTKVTLSRPINSLLDLENIPHPFEVHQLSEILARAPLKPESILHGQD